VEVLIPAVVADEVITGGGFHAEEAASPQHWRGCFGLQIAGPIQRGLTCRISIEEKAASIRLSP